MNKAVTPWVLVTVIAGAAIAAPLVMKHAGGSKIWTFGKGAARDRVPTFIDIGTTTCAPCKAMLKVMGELEARYPGQMKIEFVNIKDDENALARYGVRVIPAQIFKSDDGRELWRARAGDTGDGKPDGGRHGWRRR